MPYRDGPRRWFQGSYALRECDDPRITSATLAVHDALRTFCDSEDTCYPSVKSVAKRAYVSVRTARSHIRLLEDLGYVELIGDGGHGRHDTHLYKVHLEPPE